MELEFFKPKEGAGSNKITIHKTGKLGFSKGASDLMNIENNRYCKIAKSPDIQGNEELFMLICEEKDDYTYGISKAGDYFYVKAKQLLSELGINYRNADETIIYDIEKKNINGEVVFRLVKRVLHKRKKPSSYNEGTT